ncbi:MAG: hypothetical protein KF703_11140 [Actinobacteria bacterium]|nr:hypothetical protein [Actinomycetota bacterium]
MGARARGAAMLVAAVVLLAGCGGDDDGKDSSKQPTRTTTTTEAPTTTTEPRAPTAQPARVQVTMADDACDVPAEIAAGPVRFAATNTGTVERSLVLVRLDDGQAVDGLLAELGRGTDADLSAYRFGAGPAALAPGSSGGVQLDLEAGSYVALCTEPGASAAPAAGLVRPVTVTAPADAPDGSALPSGPTITLTDEGIEVPEGFEGKGLFRVENTGDLPHELAVYRIADDTTFVDAVEWLTATPPPAGPARASAAGGVSAVSPGVDAAVDLDLAGGMYAFVSFLPADGEGDVARGVVEQVILP